MLQRRALTSIRQQLPGISHPTRQCASRRSFYQISNPTHRRPRASTPSSQWQWQSQSQAAYFSCSSTRFAQPPTADALMDNLTDLYSTAKDEFEIAAEETEKKTVYAADDREAAKEAFGVLKEAYEKAVRESDPDTAREVQSRTGPRIKELENALSAVEEMAMED